MNPSPKKAARKTVRVATTFTGAAACAVTFAPMAHAGTVQPTAQPGYRAHQVRVNLDRVPGIHATITNGDCLGTNQSHWFHIANSASVTCFGGTGTVTLVPDFFISAECGGNNKGYISGSGPTGHRKITWNHGTTYRNIGPFSVSKVHMSGFSGNDKCPL